MYELHVSVSGSQQFEVGTYKYDFSFVLPVLIPSSFESRIGHVKHLCKVDVDIQNRLFHIKKRAPFSVAGLYDLNADTFSKVRLEIWHNDLTFVSFDFYLLNFNDWYNLKNFNILNVPYYLLNLND